jgi:hypothetical protein
MYGIGLMFLGGALFQAVSGNGHNAMGVGADGVGLAIGVYIITLVIHELIHGLAFRVFGGKVRYGMGRTGILPYFYATSPGTPFSLGQMYVIGMAPFIVLSIAALAAVSLLPSMTTYLAIAFIGNFSGAVGDLWLMTQIMRFQRFRAVTVVDEKTGMAIFTKDPRAKIYAAKLKKQTQRSNFINYWFWGTISLFMLSIIITLVGPVFQKTLTIGPNAFPLVQYTVRDKSADFSISLLPPLVVGLVFAVLTRLVLRFSGKNDTR